MIEIRNIEKTKLNKEAFISLVEKYSNTEKDILIFFDARISDCGQYVYNSKKKRHEIKISPTKLMFNDAASQTYEFTATLLHELKHLQQQEELGTNTLFSKRLSCNPKIKNQEGSDYFSSREIDARIFEELKLTEATEFYWKKCNRMIR